MQGNLIHFLSSACRTHDTLFAWSLPPSGKKDATGYEPLELRRSVSVSVGPPFSRDRLLLLSNVDDCLPKIQHCNLRIQGYLVHKQQRPPRTLQ